MDLGSLEEAKGERVPDKRNRLLRELLLDFTRHSTLHGLRYFTARGLTIFEKLFWVIIFVTSLCFSVWAMSVAWLKWQNGIIITVNEQLMPAFEVPFPAVTICPQTKVNQKYFNFTKHYITFYSRYSELLASEDKHDAKKRIRLMKSDSDYSVHVRTPSPEPKKTSKNINKRISSSTSRSDFDLINQQNRTPSPSSPRCAPKKKPLNKAGTTKTKKSNTRLRKQMPFMEKLSNIAWICPRPNYELKSFANQDMVTDIFEAAPVWRDIFFSGSFRDNDVLPLFTPILTAEGVCFTFNGLANDDILRTDRTQSNKSQAQESQEGWSLEGGYSTSDFNVYPRRGNKNGLMPDLEVLLQDDLDRVFVCEDVLSYPGFKLYLHHPADMPQTSLRHYVVQLDELVDFAIKVNVVTSSDALMKYPPHVRNCYFASEKRLQYFKVYTPSNCRMECHANLTLKRCGCLPSYMPKYQIPIDEANIFDSLCQCLPSCFSVQYEAEVTKNNLDANSVILGFDDVWNKIKNTSIPPHNNFRNLKFSGIEMYFKEEEFVTMRRSVLYGTMDLLASCGGLLGLFLGFSFMSLLELVFYFTLRLMCICRRH